jgi:hypothetical protein
MCNFWLLQSDAGSMTGQIQLASFVAATEKLASIADAKAHNRYHPSDPLTSHFHLSASHTVQFVRGGTR